MRRLVFSVTLLGVACAFAADVKRDLPTVRAYIVRKAGDRNIAEIRKREGGERFLKRFFADRDWMEQFAGSGNPGGTPRHSVGNFADALRALDLLAWNDETDWMETPIGRNVATALALNHGHEVYDPGNRWWDETKIVEVFDCYRGWDRNGTLHDTCYKLDVHGWREVVTFGQNSELGVDSLRWIHNYATIPWERYYGVCWTCSYRTFNCFGASVHGPQYYKPWAHRWNTEELRYRVGGVCGGLSKFGSHAAESHGLRSFTAGEPGHCAFMLWDFNLDKWGLGYTVTGLTGAHFSVGGDGFTALEEQNRYYSHPKRMDAEFLRWKGEYEKAMMLVPANWQAAQDWAEELKAKNTPLKGWMPWASAVLKTFAKSPSQGWQLYFIFLDQIKDKQVKLKAAKKGLLTFTEHPDKTVETYETGQAGPNAAYLPALAQRFGNDPTDLFELLPAILQGQAKSPKYYQQGINWASTMLMQSDATRFMKIVTQSALETKNALNFNDMIRSAGKCNDARSFQKVFQLMARMAPDKIAKVKKGGKEWPKGDYGGALLGNTGFLKISPDSYSWDNPANYLNCLKAEDYEADSGFHTHKSDAPWAIVGLAGETDVTGVTLVNAGGSAHNRKRQVPIGVAVSEDGVAWREVFHSDELKDEWRVALPQPIKSRFVKVFRPKDDARKEDPFHLHKILVYGKKLY